MKGHALLGLVAALAGCGKDDGPGIALDDAPAEIARAVCPRAYGCCTPMQLMGNDQAGTDPASCEARTTEGFRKQLDGVKSSVRQDRVAYHGDKLAACLDFIRNASCEDLRRTDHFSGLGCEPWLEPKVAPAGVCGSDNECIDSFCLQVGLGQGVCTPLPNAGAPCHEGRCGHGLLCDPSTKTCADAHPEGAMCTASTQCTTGNCAGSDGGMSSCAPAAPDKCFYSSACSFGHAPLSVGWATAGLAALALALGRRRRGDRRVS
jgi:hypothetical protein